MVKSKEIKNNYLSLLELLENEATLNASSRDYYNYVNEYKHQFCDESNISFTQELLEFLRGANRYSDEFVFTEKHSSEIRAITNNLYEILQNSTTSS